MPGVDCFSYPSDFPLGVRYREGTPERHPGELERPPHKPVTNCRDYCDDLLLGGRGRPGEQARPPVRPTSNCRGYPDDLPFGQ